MPQNKNYLDFMPKLGFVGNASVLYNSVNRPLVSCHQTICFFNGPAKYVSLNYPCISQTSKYCLQRTDLNHPKEVARCSSVNSKATTNDFFFFKGKERGMVNDDPSM